MSDNRNTQVNQNAVSELIALLQQRAEDTHEALSLLAVVAHAMMHSCGAKSFETKETGGEGMRFTRLLSDPHSKPTGRS
ncbi:TPA: hypothetical protein I8P26_004782, partial [Salmonella enterica subsp. enterica serovar Napoli]|nr:hypothetical protein [Salmonella enterica subsp. enterica serovar Napoli]